jgi:hypothetical protein
MMMMVFPIPAGMSERIFTWIADHLSCYQALQLLCFVFTHSSSF